MWRLAKTLDSCDHVEPTARLENGFLAGVLTCEASTRSGVNAAAKHSGGAARELTSE